MEVSFKMMDLLWFRQSLVDNRQPRKSRRMRMLVDTPHRGYGDTFWCTRPARALSVTSFPNVAIQAIREIEARHERNHDRAVERALARAETRDIATRRARHERDAAARAIRDEADLRTCPWCGNIDVAANVHAAECAACMYVDFGEEEDYDCNCTACRALRYPEEGRHEDPGWDIPDPDYEEPELYEYDPPSWWDDDYY